MRKTLLLLLLPLATISAQLTPEQKMSDFLNLAGLYAKNYAPYEWKRDVYHFDLLNLQPWLDQVAKAKDDLDFYDVCVRYVAALRSGVASAAGPMFRTKPLRSKMRRCWAPPMWPRSRKRCLTPL